MNERTVGLAADRNVLSAAASNNLQGQENLANERTVGLAADRNVRAPEKTRMRAHLVKIFFAKFGSFLSNPESAKRK